MPRKSEIQRRSPNMTAKTTSPRRHTYSSSDTVSDLFGFSMHGVDPTTEYFDQFLASPTPNDMYLDSFHGDPTMSNAVGSLPLLSLEEEKADDEESSSRKSLKRSKSIKKKKKKRNSKRLSADSESSKRSLGSKSKSSRTIKSKKTQSSEDKSFAAMLEKLEEYEESLQEERRLLQKEREEITMERETLDMKMCELESKLDELEDNNRCLAPSSRQINKDALCIENVILQRRLKRQDGIILELSNSQKKSEQSKEISKLQKELRKANELNAKNEKIIKGQKLTIKRMRKDAKEKRHSVSRDTNPAASDDESFSLFSIEIKKLNDEEDDDGSYTTFAESNFEDSLNSLGLSSTTQPSSTKKSPSRKKYEKENSTKSLGRIKNWVKRGKSNSQRDSFRNRVISPEEAALSSLVDSF